MLATFSREASLQEAGGALGDNDLLVRRDVVAVGVRNESERFWLPGVEPDVFVRQVEPAFVLHPNHSPKLTAARLRREQLRLEAN